MSGIACVSVVAAALVSLALGPSVTQESQRLPDAIADALWTAVQPALPYPAAKDDDTPVDGRPDALWLVRRLDGVDGRVFEVIANPLNEENQSRAAKAMAEIQAAVAEAERRAQAEYERSIGTTSRQRPTRDLVGISLDDEGAAGQRADWEAKLVVEVRVGPGLGEWHPSGPGMPEISSVAGATAFSVTETEYDETVGGERRRRYRPAESRLRFANGVEVTVRGNAALLRHVLAKSDWSRVAALAP